MKTIFKYPLAIADVQTIEIPTEHELLAVQAQHGAPTLWALVNPMKPMRELRISLYGTGNPVPDRLGAYIGTVQLHGGALVLHAFAVLGAPS